MKNIAEEKNYSLKDLNRAFNMGLESAVHVLESSRKLTPRGMEFLIQSLKERLPNQPKAERYLLS